MGRWSHHWFSKFDCTLVNLYTKEDSNFLHNIHTWLTCNQFVNVKSKIKNLKAS
ncbi:hypothetical protein HanXRQr2_Chr04g0186221 [Helianthus annuus]|uniref:Uncharacterized protein n=1 Tax=Helianthus annuus TaxID=4232 RepID=A0A9K3JCF6_HELAN|nr:hypothetical protein HanXRQr2_Chr04g0186221 [Helianthus annuus]